MKRSAWISFAAAAALAAGAQAQSTSITTGPDGTLNGSVSMPGAPSISVQAGGGQVTTTVPPEHARPRAGGGVVRPGTSYAGPGNSVTVRSPDGSASSSAWVSGPNGVVAGAGSPGSRITTPRPPAPPAAARPRVCPRGASKAYRARTQCRPVAVRPRPPSNYGARS